MTRQEQRRQWRQKAVQRLTAAGVRFDNPDGAGAYLRIEHRNWLVHYWPGTGTWRTTDGKRRGRTYAALLELLTERAQE